MRKLSVKFIRLAAIAAVFGACALLPGNRVFGEAASTHHPQIGDFGVDLTARGPFVLRILYRALSPQRG